MGDIDPIIAREWELLSQDKQRSQAIIAQSNNRASGLAQLLAAVLTLIGIVVAVVLAVKGIRLTTYTYWGMAVAAVSLVGSLVALSVVMWPRLGKLPKDKTSYAYQLRLTKEAHEHPGQDPTRENYEEGHYLQRISRVKERGTQVTLVTLVILVAASITAFVTIHY